MSERKPYFPGISNENEVNQIDPLDHAGFEILSMLREDGIFNMGDEKPPINRWSASKQFEKSFSTEVAYCWTNTRSFFYLRAAWQNEKPGKQFFINYNWDVNNKRKRHKQVNLPEPAGVYCLNGLFIEDQEEVVEVLLAMIELEGAEKIQELSRRLKEKAAFDREIDRSGEYILAGATIDG